MGSVGKGQPLTRDSSHGQRKVFEVSISRTYLIRVTEFGGKGERNLN